jgi:hypothetical protein
MSERKRRVSALDRVKAGKIASIEALERQMAKKNYDVIPDSESLVIDNSDLSPEEASKLITARFALI